MNSRLSRRRFLQATGTLSASLAITAWPEFSAAGQRDMSELPAGTQPEPVPFPHFPERLHAFVWRNWQLVSAERMARVVGARKADILRLGRSMGLDGPPPIRADQQRRSYITVIKRNWHLLPYEQLLELLGWTAAKLAYTLREDDFLFVKLGNAKPRCTRLYYERPDPAAQTRAREIARIIQESFPRGVTANGEPLFEFVTKLSRKPHGFRPERRSDELRFCYSYFALYGDPLLETEADPYPDGFLTRLVQAGVNGVWMQAVLYKLAPFPWDPQYSIGYRERLKNLRALALRVRKHGMRLFLYLNEPRAMPLKFFHWHEPLKGVVEGDYATLCTSVSEVQEYLRSAVAGICRAVPELGGFFSISASENLTNCWSHGGGAKCARCSTRSPGKVIGEVNRLFQEGIMRSGGKMRLLVWDWGWNDAWAEEAIRELPASASLMSVSEWLLPIERGGIKSEVGEYSLSAIGPGPRARRHWKAAQVHGLRTVAKIQAGNTWELSSIPWIPAVENAARHGENLSRAGVRDLMLGWTLGGCPSSNLEAVSEAMDCGSASQALDLVAERRFGGVLGPAMVRAWKSFSAAFQEFPYHIGVVYSGPQQLGPANLLWSEPTGYRASMVGFPYDDLDSWRAVYPAEIFVSQLERVSDGIAAALEQLRDTSDGAAQKVSQAHREAFREELRMAEAAAIHFRSSANQARFILSRNSRRTPATQTGSMPQSALRAALQSEIVLACRLHELQAEDSRLGFEASNHYFYVPVDLAEKVICCRYLLERL